MAEILFMGDYELASFRKDRSDKGKKRRPSPAGYLAKGALAGGLTLGAVGAMKGVKAMRGAPIPDEIGQGLSESARRKLVMLGGGIGGAISKAPKGAFYGAGLGAGVYGARDVARRIRERRQNKKRDRR